MNRLFSPGGDILPASEGTLIYFATYLARTVKHSTIKLYLAAVRNLHILYGHGDPVVDKLLLKKVLRDILRYQGQTRILRQPVTPRVLLAIRAVLRHWLGERDFTMIWAAFTLAFFVFFAVANLPAKEPLRIVPALIYPCPVYLLNQIWLARSGCQFFFSHLRSTRFVEVTP